MENFVNENIDSLVRILSSYERNRIVALVSGGCAIVDQSQNVLSQLILHKCIIKFALRKLSNTNKQILCRLQRTMSETTLQFHQAKMRCQPRSQP